MAHLLELPTELLNVMMIMLALSPDGARGLVRASATCKRMMSLARESDVLKLVNFQNLAGRMEGFYEAYDAQLHRNDLRCECARAGNRAAESILGKALLFNDKGLWNMILGNENGQLPSHHTLVRSFICNGRSEEIGRVRISLFSYVISFLGYNLARSSGILPAITDMCCYELMQQPPSRHLQLAPRLKMLALFDQLFPSPNV